MFWKRNSSTTCCGALLSLLNCAGGNGLSMIVTEREPGEICFEMQSRAVSWRDEDVFRAQIPSLAISINLKTSIRVKCCPWCGHSLRALVKQTPDYYRALARQHAPFDKG